MMAMLNKLSISYNQGVDDNVHSTSSITSFPFAVSIEGVDLSLLLSMIRTSEELQEKDEPWEFSKLKTEVYEIVTKLNKPL